jgi:hypothetical protein
MADVRGTRRWLPMGRRHIAVGLAGTLLVALLVAFVAADANATTIAADNGFISSLGATTTIRITLDEAPNGLSGYTVTVSLSAPAVAEVIDVSFPDWGSLNDNSALPTDSLWMKAVDLDHEIEAGATDIELGTVTIRGDAQGTCAVTVTIDRVDDDDGNPMSCSASAGALTVGGTSAVFRVDSRGHVLTDSGFYGSAFLSGSADVAEWVTVSEPVEAGDVLAIDLNNPLKYRRAVGPCSALTAGVVSTTPGMTLGGAEAPGKALMALVGIVPVKACDENGPIFAGDLLVVSSTPGYVMRWNGTGSCSNLVGKALESLDGSYGVILVLLTR